MKAREPIRDEWTLAASDLQVRRGNRCVLDGVNLTVHAGDCVSLIGPNGSGKTTLMLAVLGMLPLSRGRAAVDGTDVHRASARWRGRFAAYVPQVVDRIPAFTVYDVVAAGRFPHVPPLRPLSARDTHVIDAALARGGLTALAARPINAVSGGERQKALLAAAVAQEPRLMCLDEPGTALDPGYQLELARLLRDWLQPGRAVLLISHDLQLPAALGGRVVALREGRVVADGPAGDVLQPDRLAEIYDAPFETARTASGRNVVLPNWWTAAS